MKLNPYLHFEGRGADAVNFYQKVFNAQIALITRYGESLVPSLPEYKNYIMHARLEFGENIIMISDIMPGRYVVPGNNLSLSIGLASQDDTKAIFEQLAVGGMITMPLETQFWGSLYGQVTDKFGVDWMLNCPL